MPRKPTPIERGRTPTDNHQMRPPTVGHDGRPITGTPWRGAPNHGAIANDPRFNERVREHNREEHERGRYYWHEEGGRRYCHHYDEWGHHWYGFYIGPSYYWCRWENDFWWWYDPIWGRWCYHRNGFWWWQDPMRVEVIYVYRDNAYYQYDDTNGGVVLRPAPPADNTPAPTPQPAAPTEFYSSDGSRLVRVYGDKKEAYLYSESTGEDSQTHDDFLAFLGDGVTDVKFKNGDDGSVQQVLTILQDNSFGLFDKNGQAVAFQDPTPPQPTLQGLQTPPVLDPYQGISDP